jgi:hypothetical protein
VSGFANALANAAGQLIRTALRSVNYVPGVSGWTINKDGTAEFNSVTIRGGVTEDGTILLYTGTPAAGTLWLSIAAAAGTDAYGNTYPAGIKLSGASSSFLQLLANAQVAEIVIQPPAATGHSWGTGTITGSVSSWQASNGNPELAVTSPVETGKTGPAKLELIGPSTASNESAALVSADFAQITPTIATEAFFGVIGQIDASVALTAGNLASGQVSITPVANTPTSVAVTGLGLSSGVAYRATATAVSSSPGSHVLGVSVTGVTNNGLTVWIDRNDTTATNVDYLLLGLG